MKSAQKQLLQVMEMCCQSHDFSTITLVIYLFKNNNSSKFNLEFLEFHGFS